MNSSVNSIEKDNFYLKTKHILTLFEFIKNNKVDQFLDYLSSLEPDDLDINLKDQNGNYLINFAIIMNNRLLLTKIIDYGARLDIVDYEGYGIMYYPIRFNYKEVIDILLKYDKKTVGMSLVNIKDTKDMVPLFYAIKYNNEYALQELLSNGADANYKNKNGITSLHLAIHKKNATMVKQIMLYDKSIDFQSYNGSTALHYACNFELFNIVKILLEKGANVDISEHEFEFIPIFYSVIQNNIQICKLLIDNLSNPNHQDKYGNTFCYYCVENDNYEILDYIFLKYRIEKKNRNIYNENINLTNSDEKSVIKIDPDIVNLDGITLCHIMLYKYKQSYDTYIEKLLPYVNLNYQDNKGNTILHLLIYSEIWQKFIHIIENKKMNIYIKNNNGKTVYDLIPLSLKECFINTVANSYYAYLNKHLDGWDKKWQNQCADTNLPVAKKDECLKIIKKNIIKKNISLPQKKNKINISIVNDPTVVKFNTFIGSSLDLVCGFKYLTKKYKHVTSILNSNQQLTKELSDYYASLGIQENPNQYLIQFEIKWIYQRIFLPPNFETIMANIIKNNRYKFVVIPLGIILSNGTHSNGLFYDIENKSFERFEPHGSAYPYQFNYNPKLFDDVLKKKLTNIIRNIYNENVTVLYVKPSDYSQKIGFQTFENTEISVNKNIGDPNGFCTLWTIWYLDHRIKYSSIDPKKITKYLINSIKLNNKSFRDTIRNYSINITSLRDEYLKMIDKDVNDYINNRISKTELKKLLIEIISDNITF